jgi:hypothetical protein
MSNENYLVRIIELFGVRELFVGENELFILGSENHLEPSGVIKIIREPANYLWG